MHVVTRKLLRREYDRFNRQHSFQELSGLDPTDVCRRALCHYDASNRWYTLSVWGQELRIVPHRLTIESKSNNKHHLASDMIDALAVGVCRQLGLSHDDRAD